MRPPFPFPGQANAAGALARHALRVPTQPGPLDGIEPDKPAIAAPPRTAAFLLELGLTCAALGETEAAIATLRQAVALKPGLGPAWRKLGALLSLTGDAEGARAALAAAGAAAASHPAKAPAATKIDLARRHLAQKLAAGPPQEAGRVLRQHLKQAPSDVAALCLLAEIGARAKQHQAAEMLLERALELAPLYVPARHEYAAVLQAQSKNVQALPHLTWLLAQDPRNVQYRTLMAVSLADVGAYEKSLTLYEGLAGEAAKKPSLLLIYAHALTYAGRRAEAVSAYRRCIGMAPALGDAWWGLANLKTETFVGADIDAMRAYLARDGMPQRGRISVHYALGLALEQEADYASSFTHYASGAALHRQGSQYDAGAWSREMQETAAFFSDARLAAMDGAGCQDPAPIFILGMPRAGSTLIEQILSSHSAVEGTQELPEIGHIVRDMGGFLRLGPQTRYPQRLATMDAAEIQSLGARYIARSATYRRTAKPFFIDKTPHNWAYAGLIHLILPRAKIIDARRAPMASCFSAFKQLFAYGAEYSYDLSDLARYYTDYTGLMAHFDRVLPGRIHRVSYENMVQDTEAEIRSLLAYCGLAFEPACLRFWETRRAVSTASSEQVRKPIFRDGLEQWRHYESWLGPLQAGLG